MSAKSKAYAKEYYRKNSDRLKKAAREYGSKNKAAAREAMLARNYGITSVEYNIQLEAQDHRCAICYAHESQFKKPLAVDHCHKTGENRGLLCSSCNTALGSIKDNPKTAINMYNYLALCGTPGCEDLI